MSEVVLVKHRIEPGKTERPREWMQEIRRRRDEALEPLQHEGVISEAAFFERTDEADCLIYYTEADDIDGVYEAFESSPYEIDHDHQAVLVEVLAEEHPDVETELLYHLVNPEYRTTPGISSSKSATAG